MVPPRFGSRKRPGTPFEVLLRVPGWAGSHHFAVNGKEVVPAIVGGYAAISRVWRPGDEITARFEMPVQAHYSHYEVIGNRGRVAISRGPLIYCAEEADNGGHLDQIAIDPEMTAEVSQEDCELGEIVSLLCVRLERGTDGRLTLFAISAGDQALCDQDDSVLLLG